LAIQAGGLLFDFLPKQGEFLLKAGRRILGQHREGGGGINQATAEAGR
jgi:sugar/nucleoside kinase (ribokinase family)